MKYLLIAILLTGSLKAQIPPNANTIIVKGVSFKDVCNKLLDSNYEISKKDSELGTVSTIPKPYPKYWNAEYIINIRVTDSTAFITALTISPLGKSYAFNHTNKKGETYQKSNLGYPFLLLNDFAGSFNKGLVYIENKGLK